MLKIVACAIVGFGALGFRSVEAQVMKKDSKAAPKRIQSRPRSLNRMTREAYDRDVVRARQESERYRGLLVMPHPAAKGEALVFQEQIGSLMMKSDFVPDKRVQGFRWIPTEIGRTITGWQGNIMDVTPGPEGMVVTMRVVPRMDGYGKYHTTAYAVERYLFTKGRIIYLDSEGPNDRGIEIIN